MFIRDFGKYIAFVWDRLRHLPHSLRTSIHHYYLLFRACASGFYINTDLAEISSDNGSDSDSSSDPELDSEVSDEDGPDHNAFNAFDGEGQLPPEHYLAHRCHSASTEAVKRRYSGKAR